MKLSLPVQLHNRHHLFFRFYHISCEASKSGSRLSSSSVKKKDSIETPVGYAWMPILHDGRCVGAGVVCGVRASVVCSGGFCFCWVCVELFCLQFCAVICMCVCVCVVHSPLCVCEMFGDVTSSVIVLCGCGKDVWGCHKQCHSPLCVCEMFGDVTNSVIVLCVWDAWGCREQCHSPVCVCVWEREMFGDVTSNVIVLCVCMCVCVCVRERERERDWGCHKQCHSPLCVWEMSGDVRSSVIVPCACARCMGMSEASNRDIWHGVSSEWWWGSAPSPWPAICRPATWPTTLSHLAKG